MLKVADMPDLAGLIAPRDLILVAGKQDGIARFDGVEKGFQMARIDLPWIAYKVGSFEESVGSFGVLLGWRRQVF